MCNYKNLPVIGSRYFSLFVFTQSTSSFGGLRLNFEGTCVDKFYPIKKDFLSTAVKMSRKRNLSTNSFWNCNNLPHAVIHALNLCIVAYNIDRKVNLPVACCKLKSYFFEGIIAHCLHTGTGRKISMISIRIIIIKVNAPEFPVEIIG